VSTQVEVCHRIGGGSSANLRLQRPEERLSPPGISVLLGGTPEQAAGDFRRVFGPKSSPGRKASVVGTAEIGKIRDAGFDVIEDPTRNFPNHGRVVHPTLGVAGFQDEPLRRLSEVFTDKTGL
jgi:hypothetical protein